MSNRLNDTLFEEQTHTCEFCENEYTIATSDAWDTTHSWKVRFSVVKKDIGEDGNLNCDWKWIKLKKEFETEPEAREAVKKALPKIIETYEFHFSD